MLALFSEAARACFRLLVGGGEVEEDPYFVGGQSSQLASAVLDNGG